MKTLFALIESPFPPDFPDLYQELSIVAERFDSARNLHRALQKQAPDFFSETTGFRSQFSITYEASKN